MGGRPDDARDAGAGADRSRSARERPRAREQEIKTREKQLRQQEAGLTAASTISRRSRFEAPFDGIVTRRNVEVGENVVVGTMNNAGTVLLTIADMSVIEAEVEVDETDIPLVQIGQPAKVTIDAIAGQDVQGTRHRDRQQPDSGGGRAAATRTATNFKVVVTHRRADSGSASRVHLHGGDHHGDAQEGGRRADSGADGARADLRREGQRRPRAAAAEAALQLRPDGEPRRVGVVVGRTQPGQKREEVEGVFLVRDGKAEFVR